MDVFIPHTITEFWNIINVHASFKIVFGIHKVLDSVREITCIAEEIKSRKALSLPSLLSFGK